MRWRWGAVMTVMAWCGWAIMRRPTMGSAAAFTSLRVEGGEEGVVGAGRLKVGDEVPEGSCLVVVAYGRHVRSQKMLCGYRVRKMYDS